jgi:glutamate N-acetyltransferase / amino-acid N-acetyltransferase
MIPVVATWGPTDRSALTPIDGGGVTAVPGFRAGAVAAGIKASGRPDLALVVADRPSTLAVSVTTNRVRAACCDVAVEHAASGTGRAVVINAGNANACTPQGREHALATCDAVARELGAAAADIVPMSTGVIGVPMPINRLLAGIPNVAADASGDLAGGQRAAEAILTTDLAVKQVAYHVIDGQGRCTIGAMAKGSGMIEPAMATMLAVITTDAPIPGAVLRPMLKQAVRRSFNRISVDACGSTNDTVAVLASGAASTPPGLPALQAGIEAVCADLAAMIVRDGEGVTRVARITVGGAASEDDATTLARSIAASALFRTALHGGDPNWGRILAAMGSTDVVFDPARVSVTCGGVTVCRFGAAASFDVGQAAHAMSQPQVDIGIDLGLGDARATFLVGDLSRDYVTINADYTT